jgi:hypothetical protein
MLIKIRFFNNFKTARALPICLTRSRSGGAREVQMGRSAKAYPAVPK